MDPLEKLKAKMYGSVAFVPLVFVATYDAQTINGHILHWPIGYLPSVLGLTLIVSMLTYSSWLGLTSGRPQHEFWPAGFKLIIFFIVQMVVVCLANGLLLNHWGLS
jgi:hypothetical protein